MNCVHFQLALLAYNRNCWLMLFHRAEQAQVADLRHTTLATARLRFLFLAAKSVRHAGSVLVRDSDHDAEKQTRGRLLDRLRAIVPSGPRFAPVVASALRLGTIRVPKILGTVAGSMRMTYAESSRCKRKSEKVERYRPTCHYRVTGGEEAGCVHNLGVIALPEGSSLAPNTTLTVPLKFSDPCGTPISYTPLTVIGIP
jgi:hypothetical protein